MAALEALWTEGQGAGGDTRESAPNWTRPAAAASLRNTAPRSKAPVFMVSEITRRVIVGWSSFDVFYRGSLKMGLRLVSEDEQPQAAPTWEEFWKLYPRRMSGIVAKRSWEKMTAEEKKLAVAAIPRHIQMWRDEERTMALVPYPATWLNQKRWEDEIDCELPQAVHCRWPGCKSVGLKMYGGIACCDRHHDAYVRGLTP